MEKLSVTIITRNEEKNIERCLKSVGWADEIVVLDTFSSDKTVDICRRYTDRVFQDDWHGYGKQKNLCAARTRNRWVLNVDADEEISPACAEEIQKELERGPEHPLYYFPRKNFFGGRWVRYAGWYPDMISRLYDKTRVSFTEPLVHEDLMPNENAGRFEEALLHYSFEGMEDYIARQNRYSSLYAQERVENHWRAGWTHLYLRPPLVFLKTFFLRQGFREGFLGMFLSLSMAYYTFLKYAKTHSNTKKEGGGVP
ncbi:MAG: glycosyltransferase family 2 protein [Nitrospinaceae bacterium]